MLWMTWLGHRWWCWSCCRGGWGHRGCWWWMTRGFIAEERSWVLDNVNILPATLQIPDTWIVDLRCHSVIWDIRRYFQMTNILTNIQTIEDFCYWKHNFKSSPETVLLAPSTNVTELCNNYHMIEHIQPRSNDNLLPFSLGVFKPTLEEEEGGGGWVISVSRLLLLQLCLVQIGAPSLAPPPHTPRLFQSFYCTLYYCCQLLYADHPSLRLFIAPSIPQHLEQDYWLRPVGRPLRPNLISQTFCGGKSKRRFQIKISAGDFKTLWQRAFCTHILSHLMMMMFLRSEMLTQLEHTWFCLGSLLFVWAGCLGKQRRCWETIISLHNGPWLLIFTAAAQRMKNPDLRKYIHGIQIWNTYIYMEYMALKSLWVVLGLKIIKLSTPAWSPHALQKDNYVCLGLGAKLNPLQFKYPHYLWWQYLFTTPWYFIDICSYLIIVIFSPQVQFHAKTCKLQKNTDFETKQRKRRQNTISCTQFFSTLQIHVENFFTWHSVIWRISQIDNLSCGDISAHEKILHRHRLWCMWQICMHHIHMILPRLLGRIHDSYMHRF